MKGHIRKRGPKTYAVIIELGRGQDNKRHQQWHTVHGTKKDAETELARLLHEVNSGLYAPPEKLSVKDYL